MGSLQSDADSVIWIEHVVAAEADLLPCGGTGKRIAGNVNGINHGGAGHIGRQRFVDTNLERFILVEPFAIDFQAGDFPAGRVSWQIDLQILTPPLACENQIERLRRGAGLTAEFNNRGVKLDAFCLDRRSQPSDSGDSQFGVSVSQRAVTIGEHPADGPLFAGADQLRSGFRCVDVVGSPICIGCRDLKGKFDRGLGVSAGNQLLGTGGRIDAFDLNER